MKHWNTLFEPHILQRGYDYWLDDQVLCLDVYSDHLEAEVYGTRIYTVTVFFKNGLITDMQCSCPYADDGQYCKHMAAVLFEWEGRRNDSADGILQSAEDRPRRLQHAASTAQAMDPDACNSTINRIARKYHHNIYYIDLNDVFAFINEISHRITEYTDALIADKRYRDALAVVNHAFTLLTELEIEDPDHAVSELEDIILSYWEKLFVQLNNAEKEEMMAWFIKMQTTAAFDCFADLLSDFADAHFRDPISVTIQTDLLYQALDCILSSGSRMPYHCDLDRLLYRYLWLLHTDDPLLKKEDPLLRKYPDDLLLLHAYIRCYTRDQHYTAALCLLEHCITLSENSPKAIYDYKKQKKDLYRISEQMELYRVQLWELVLCDASEDILSDYRELKALYTPEAWSYLRDGIFLHQNDVEREAMLYCEEQLYDRLIVCITDTPGLSLVYTYFKVLKKEYPDILLQKFTLEVDQMADMANDRRMYRQLVQMLRKMKTLRGGKAAVHNIVLDLRERYHNRYAFLEELSDL